MSKTKSFAKNLYCAKCKKEYSLNEIHQLCECGAPLLVNYDLQEAKKKFKKEDLAGRVNSLWRYEELLPVQDDENIVSLGEGLTPIIPLSKAGRKSGITNLYIKDEGVIPTGTFKARGAAVGVSRAKELGVSVLAIDRKSVV